MGFYSTRVSEKIEVGCEDCEFAETQVRNVDGHYSNSRGLSHAMDTGHTVLETRTTVNRTGTLKPD